MTPVIENQLQEIAAREDVCILYACEAGSRIWGFASPDSDYDVRFIYVNRPEWYLSMRPENKTDRRDVIEPDVDDAQLDISGWDLRKALRLMLKFNPSLLEWLRSPLVYHSDGILADRLRNIIDNDVNLDAAKYHYLHMAKFNYREYLRGAQVQAKKYLYVLRPLLALQWMVQGYGVPPLPLHSLTETLLPKGKVASAVQRLLDEKAVGAEHLKQGAWSPRIDVLSDYLDKELQRLETVIKDARRGQKNTGKEEDIAAMRTLARQLDELFREELSAAWGPHSWQPRVEDGLPPPVNTSFRAG